MPKIRLPLARLVAGTPYGTDKNYKGEVLLDKKTQKPYTNWKLRLAIPKQPGVDWRQTEWGRQIEAVAKELAPHHYQSKKFAWKVENGDSTEVDGTETVINQREGFAGHWVLTTQTRVAPQYAEFQNGAAVFVDANDLATFKHNLELKFKGTISEIPSEILNRTIVSGDYVYVTVDVSAQTTGETPSIYLSPKTITLNSKGSPIVTFEREDLSDLRQQAGPGSVAPLPTVVAPTVSNKQFVNGPPVAPPPSVTPPPPKVVEYVMTEKATATREAYHAANWSDELLIQHGLMVRVN